MPIGFLRSDFGEKFGTPRQAGLAPAARARLELPSAEWVRGLEGFSHVWLIFVFHALGGEHGAGASAGADAGPKKTKALVRPPRLGGARKLGVLATRSPHRPNPVGLSAVALEAIEPGPRKGGATLVLRGADLVDGTPILDVKPYVPYADSIPGARGGWVEELGQQPAGGGPAGPGPRVGFEPEALATLERLGGAESRRVRELIEQVLRLDPRPAFQGKRAREQAGTPGSGDARPAPYAALLAGFDVHWTVAPGDGACRVTGLLDPKERVKPASKRR